MTWKETVSKRTEYAKHFTDGRRFIMQSILKTPLHYNDEGWQDIDLRPQRVTNDKLDGWLVNQNGWHYAMGRPSNRTEDGWVGFGARQGQHWLQFRLLNIGYMHWPTRVWRNIGGAPTYDRAQLAMLQQPVQLGYGDEINPCYVSSSAKWQGIWSTPGDGDISVQWTLDGQRLKEEIVVNQEAREWIATNEPPETAASETYFGFVFELDVSDIPKLTVSGIIQNINDDISDDDGPIELRDVMDELLAFLPIDYVTVGEGENAKSVRLRKRIYQINGRIFLLLGGRVDLLNKLPLGDLLFDPTFSTQPAAAAGKDTWINKPTPSNNYASSLELYLHGKSSYDRKAFIEFDCSSIPAGSVATSADLELVIGNQNLGSGVSISAYSLHSNVSDWTEIGLTYDDYKGSSSWPGSAGANTAGTDYEAGSLGSASGPATKDEVITISLSSRVDGWYGVSNTNYGLMLVISGTAFASVFASDSGTASRRPKLTIEYEEQITQAQAVVYTTEPTVVQSSTTATPSAAKVVAYTDGPTIVQGSVPPTLLSYTGNIFLSSKGNELAVCLLVTEGDYWRLLDSSSVIEQLGVVFTRHVGYVVPQ